MILFTFIWFYYVFVAVVFFTTTNCAEDTPMLFIAHLILLIDIVLKTVICCLVTACICFCTAVVCFVLGAGLFQMTRIQRER